MKKSIYIALFAGIAITIVAVVFPFDRGEAQQNPEKASRQIRELEQLRQVDVASRFYDNLRSKENAWMLVDFHPPDAIDKDFSMSKIALKTPGTAADILIYEFPTATLANESIVLHGQLSSRVVKYTVWGEQGQKVYGYGGFANLGYRVGRYVIHITSADESAAERLAAYAFETVSQFN